MKITWLPLGLREGLSCCSSRRPITSKPTFRYRAPLSAILKPFSTSSQLRADTAASEAHSGNKIQGDKGKKKIFYARLVPDSPSYFSAEPQYTDDLLSLQALLARHSALPMVKPEAASRVAWKSLVDYRSSFGETIKASKYHKMVAILDRLHQIHPSVMPSAVREALDAYKRDINPHSNKARPIPIDQFGRALGVGRRKSSVAKAYLVEGTGEVIINGKTLAEVFGRIHDRESAIWALKATDRIDKYNLWALVSGGGTTGQAEALTLAVGKALLSHEPALKPALRRAGCVTRDPRRVERKKPGRVKARKMPTWVKR